MNPVNDLGEHIPEDPNVLDDKDRQNSTNGINILYTTLFFSPSAHAV